ncbi:MAG: glycosyltransferase [Nibricoccus sp.]
MPKRTTSLLFVTRTSPFAGESGSGAYVFDLLRYLAGNGVKIHTVWTEPPDLVPQRGWYTPPREARGVSSLEIMGAVKLGTRFWKHDVVWLPFKARASHVAKTVLRSLGLWRKRCEQSSPTSLTQSLHSSSSPSWGANCSAAERSIVQKAIARFRPDVVLANYAWMAPAAAVPGPLRRPIAVLTHDVRHRQLHLANGQVREVLGEYMTAQDELACLASADGLIAIQETEASVFQRLFPNKQIVTAPLAVRPNALPFSKEPVVLFVGSHHVPNVAGVHWFIDLVWPLIRAKFPAAQLHIAGSVCDSLRERTTPTEIQLLGRIRDLAEPYSRSRVVIAPILQGSGLKIKIIEAVSYGRPCVTTSVGAEGLENLQPALRVANTHEGFANEVLGLLSSVDRAQTAAEETLKLACTHFSVDACYRPVSTLLQQLATARP